MKLGPMIILGTVYTEPRLRPIQISIGSVYILLVWVSVSGSVNEPLYPVFSDSVPFIWNKLGRNRN